MKPDRKCPICGGEFEEGVIPDRANLPIKMVSQWAKNIDSLGVSANFAKNIQAYRCQSCGYLESYAK